MGPYVITRDEGDALKPWQRALFSLGTFGVAGPGTITVQLQLYFTKYLGYPAMVLSSVRFALMVFDAVTDPLMGYISDRTRSRFGRRMPYLAVGALLLAFSSVAMWFAPPGLAMWQIVALLVVAQLVYSIGVTMTDVPYRALVPELARSYNARNTLVAWMQAGTYLGTVFGGAVRIYSTWRQDEVRGFREFAVLASVLMVLCFWSIVVGLREPPDARVVEGTHAPRSPGDYLRAHLRGLCRAMVFALANRRFLLLFMAIFTYQVGVLAGMWLYTFLLDDWFGKTWDTPFARAYVPLFFRDAFFLFTFFAIGCGLLFLPLWTWLGKRWEKRTCLTIGILGVGLTYGVSYFLFAPKSYPLFILYCLVLGFFYTPANIFPTSMLADIATDSEYETGEANEGMFYGAFSLLTKAYNAVALLWTGYMLDHVVHYDRGVGAVQSAETLLRMRTLYAFPPAVAAILAVLFLVRYDLSRTRMARVNAALAARRASNR